MKNSTKSNAARRKELYSLLGDLPDRKRPIRSQLITTNAALGQMKDFMATFRSLEKEMEGLSGLIEKRAQSAHAESSASSQFAG